MPRTPSQLARSALGVLGTRARRVRRVVLRWRDRRLERAADRLALAAARVPSARAERIADRLLAGADAGRPTGLAVRAVLSGVLPVDPLAGRGDAADVEVVIPCHGRDAELLPVVIAGARAAVGRALAGLRIVVPAGEVAVLTARPELGAADVHVVSEDEVVPREVREAVVRLVPERRRGHVLQQLIKFFGAAGSRAEAALVLDADTVLLRPRTWVLRDGRQLLAVSHECHEPYRTHHWRIWPSDGTSRISFVTHHQVMQPDVLRGMFGEDLAAGVIRWLEPAEWVIERDYGSEYHDYGTWLRANAGDRVVAAAFRNDRGPRSRLPDGRGDPAAVVARLARRHPSALSFSLHAYL